MRLVAVLLPVVGFLGGGVVAVASASGGSSSSCPSTAPHGIASNSWPRSQRRLAPHGARTISLCRYSGMNSHPDFGLVGSDLVTARSTIHRLIRRFDALKSPPPNQAFSCPADDGSQIVATLLYRAQHEVQISVTLSGCQTATNGDLRRAAFDFDNRNPQGPKLVSELQALTRH